MDISSFYISKDVPGAPHQLGPGFKFPKRSFGKKAVVYRSFQHSWFTKSPFLHYKESSDVAYCHTCLLVFKEKSEDINKGTSGICKLKG